MNNNTPHSMVEWMLRPRGKRPLSPIRAYRAAIRQTVRFVEGASGTGGKRFNKGEQVIQGLKVTVPGEKVADLIEARIKHHRERAAFYAEKVTALEGVGDLNEGKSSVIAPADQMRQKKQEHEREATELQFMRDHLKLTEEYLLDRTDLNRLGIVQQGW